jgi:hypothetical protein
MAARHQKENEWKAAKKRCRLNDEEVSMAKELGIGPRSLIKNIPSPSQRWKLPVKEWVRNLYSKKFGRRRSQPDATKTSPPPLRDDNGLPLGFLAERAEPGPVDPNADIDIPF